MSTDHYETLGVSRDATDDEIKRAYKKLARTHHPDLNPGDADAEATFKQVGAAYEVLHDPERRARYDRYGDDGPPADPFGGGLGDIFEAFFGGGSNFGGGGRGRSGPPGGEDLEAHVDLDLEEVVFGGDHEVTVKTAIRCDDCDGSGAEAGTAPAHCDECGGSGQVRRVRQSVLGQMVTASACTRCAGLGYVVDDPCPTCDSNGRTIENRTYAVQVPPGVDNGTTLRLSGRGAAGPRGGAHGDLYVHVHVRPHPRFHRDGNDLVHDFYIPFTQAVLGAHIEYETLDGVEDLVIPQATESGTEFRMRGRGVPHVRGRGRGDLRVRVFIDVPDQLGDEQEALLREFAEQRGEVVAEPGQSLFGRIKSAFS
ncbi:MAG: molecular chaperone DnaJ [Acidimicrobiales bacterium]|nr:molecular chaperone DnaJ [Acidimicrobiales bacterium]